MDSGKSSNGEDIDDAFHLKRKIDCEEGNSMETSPNGKENTEGNPDISPCSSTPNENEIEVSRPVLQSKTEKLPIECEVNKPRISRPNFSNETNLEIKDGLLQKFRSTHPETVSETKDNSTRISSQVIPDEGLSESEAILTKITCTVLPDEGSSDSKGNKAQISIIDVSDEICLESKMGSFQISSSNKWKGLAKKDNASGNNTNLPLLSSLAIPSAGSSESSPILSSVTIPSASASESSPIQSSVTNPSEGDLESSPLSSRIFEFHASGNDYLSLEENESFFKLSEKSTRNRSKTERKKAVRRQKRYQLASKDSQNTGDDCQDISSLQTNNMPIKWKFSPFKKPDFADPEETPTETKDNLTLRTSLTVPDVTTSESTEQFSREHSLAGFDETGLENEFSSLQIANPVNPDKVSSKNNAYLPQESSSLVFDRDLINPDLHSRINRCVDTITSWITSYQETLSSFEASAMERSSRKHKKAVIKQKRYQSPSKESEKEANYSHAVSPTKTLESGIECEGYSPRISRPLVSDEAASENKASHSHITQDLDEYMLWSLGIPSSNYHPWLTTCEQRSSISIHATEWNEDGRNLKISKLHPESSLGDDLIDLSIPSTSKVSPTKTSEIRNECEGYSPRISRPLVSDEAASENKASLPLINITQDLDEDTLWNLGILSSDCNSWLPNLEQRSSRSINATEMNEGKSYPESSRGDNLVDLSIPSTSKVSPSAKSTQNSKSLYGEHNTNNPDNSKVTESVSQVEDSSLQFNRNPSDLRRNSRLNRSTHVSFRVGDNRIVRFPVPNNPLRVTRSDKEAQGGNVQNTSEANRNQSQSSFSKTDDKEININQSQSSFSKTDNKERNRNRSPSGSRKTDNNEKESDNQSE